MKRKRTKRNPVVQALINDVVAFNKVLKEKANSIEYWDLLNNCHPLYREDHARELQKIGLISEKEAFVYKIKYK